MRDLSAEPERDAASSDAGREVDELQSDPSDLGGRPVVGEWADLLRHKAAALRAVRDADLRPGSVDPTALAEVLSGLQPPHPRAAAEVPRDAEAVLRHALQVWDSVADTEDPQAIGALAAECETVAAQLDALSR